MLKNNTQPKHILVVRFSAMGDVAMAVPVLKILIQQNPNLRITFVSKALFKPIFNSVPNLQFYAADLKGKHKGFFGLYRLFKELNTLNIDAVADLHNVLRSKVLSFFFLFKKKPVAQIDKGRAEKKALISGKIFRQLKTTHQRYGAVFKKLNLKLDFSKSQFEQQEKKHSNKKQTIGIAPFAAHQGKTYPYHLMEEVIAKLNKLDIQIFLFGAAGNEQKRLEILANKYANVSCVAGKYTLEKELSIIANLGLMVAMDSGNAHLAAIYKTPTITLWGVTHPYAGFYPFGQPIGNAILADRTKFPKIPTSVYGNKVPADYHKVMETIPPLTVVKKVIQLIEN